MKNRKGFAIVEFVLVVAVLAVLGTVGYLAYNNFVAPKPTEEAALSTQPVKINNAKDLDAVNSELDKLPVDDSDLDQLDNAINSF